MRINELAGALHSIQTAINELEVAHKATQLGKEHLNVQAVQIRDLEQRLKDAMKAWAIEFTGRPGREVRGALYYTGLEEMWTDDVETAICFARERDVKTMLRYLPLLRGKAVSVELTEGLQPVEKKNGDEAVPGSD